MRNQAWAAIVLCCAIVLAARAGPATYRSSDASQTSDVDDALVSLERDSWAAWQKRDGTFFADFLDRDHVEVGFSGIAGKSAVVETVRSPKCVVSSYKLDHFQVVVFNPTTAVVTYRAEQDTKCGGQAVPSPVWVSSLYIRRGERWTNAVYQQTLAAK
jgi:hypothetical protein